MGSPEKDASDVTVWFTLSALVQMTVVPGRTRSVEGVNPFLPIETIT